MRHKPTNVFFRNRETGWCSHATVEISDIAEFKRQHRAMDLPVVERKAGVAKDSRCPKKTLPPLLEGQLTIFIPAKNGHDACYGRSLFAPKCFAWGLFPRFDYCPKNEFSAI